MTRWDGATPSERQRFIFDKALEVLNLEFAFEEKEEARNTMIRIGNLFRDWNYAPWDPSVLASPGEEQSRSKGRENRNEDKNNGKPGPEISEGGGDPEENRNNPGGKEEKHNNSEAPGEFKKILAEIDDFIESKGGRMAGKKDGEGREKHSSHLALTAKTVKTDARPRSRRTLLGRGAEEEDTGREKKDEKR